jgi:flavodoxin I
MSSAIFYGSSTGNTENAAKQIREELGGKDVIKLFDISTSGVDKIKEYDKLIIGVSTWGEGDLQDDWDEIFEEFKNIDFSNKTVAFFGLGDQESYSDEYVDAMATLYEVVSQQEGANIIGSWPIDKYEFDESRAVVNGEFVGLALDEDNQSELTPERIKTWCSQIKEQIL